MKKTFITIIILVAVTVAKAQQSAPKSGDPNVEIKTGEPDTSSVNNSKVFTAVEVIPSFPGGMEKFYEFLKDNIRYPAEAARKNVQGKVFLVFVIERDGSLSNIKVARAIGSGCDEEAVRVMKLSPKWNPGTVGNKPVRVAYTMPLSFTLAGR
jgi:protein TonB